jgi:hypothetical protein
LHVERLEERSLLAIDSGLAVATPYDVNRDGIVSALDAIQIINELTRNGIQTIASTDSKARLDVNGDGLISGLDAMQVINRINQNGRATQASAAVESQQVQQQQQAQASISLEITDLANNPLQLSGISPVVLTQTGQRGEFLVNIYANDLRTGLPTSTGGLYAVYAQLSFDPRMVQLLGDDTGDDATDPNDLITDPVDVAAFRVDPVTFNPTYLGGQAVDLITNTATLVTYEIGARDGSTALGGAGGQGSRALIATVRMRVTDNALNFGSTISFVLSAATETGHEVIGYRSSSGEVIPTDSITYTGSQVQISSAPTIEIGDATPLPEGTAATSAPVFRFPVTLTGTITQPVTVIFSTVNGTALAGSDYVARTGQQLIFTPGGSTTQFIEIQGIPDSVTEPDENFYVNIRLGAGTTQSAVILRAQAQAVIISDEAPGLFIYDVRVAEGDTGITPMRFPVVLAGDLSQLSGDVLVNFVVLPAGATPGVDYAPAAGQITIPASSGQLGQQVRVITVNVFGDTDVEPDERLTVTISASGFLNRTAIGTIVNDDLGTVGPVLPSVSINDAALTEPASGSAAMTFTVTVSGTVTETVTVRYETRSNTAISGRDFQAASGQLTFVPGGATSQTITIQINADDELESDETFFVDLSVTNATLADGRGVGTIRDLPPNLLFVDRSSTTEGDVGLKNLGFVVRLQRRTGDTSTVTVNFATQDNTAIAGEDYLPVAGMLTFAPGVTTLTIQVPIIGDLLNEDNETFFVNLAGAQNAVFSPTSSRSAQVVGTILNDDPVPDLSIEDVTLFEGLDNATFKLRLGAPSGQIVRADFATGGGTATPRLDYLPTSGTVIFLPGEVEKEIAIQVYRDNADEGSETFFLNLSNAVNTTLNRTFAMATINDIPLSMLSGFVYGDMNGNGVRDAGDLGLNGVVMRLSGTNIFGEQVSQEVRTVPSGLYQFTRLLPGTYHLQQVQPQGLIDGEETIGTLGGEKPLGSNDLISNIVIPLGISLFGENYNFGETGNVVSYLTHDVFFSR